MANTSKNKKGVVQPNATKKESDLDKAKRVLIEERSKRENACLKELQDVMSKVLQKHNCDFILEGQFIGEQIKTGMRVISK